eukprot:jgi/Ulvmu1/1890/UM012_0047.1
MRSTVCSVRSLRGTRCLHVPCPAFVANRQAASIATPVNYSHTSFPLEPGGVAVWWMDPAQIPRSYVARYAHWLSTTELEHVCASKNTQEEHSRLCSRVLLRSALATCLGTGWQLSDFKFQVGEFGKPMLVTDGLPKRIREFDFNITHTDGLIGLAVAAGAKVGIDCERIDRTLRSQVEKIAGKMFSAEEQEELLQLPEGSPRLQRFIEKWTLKEAFVKATGRGLKGATTRFSIVGHDAESGSAAHLAHASGLRYDGIARQLTVSSAFPADQGCTYAVLQCMPTESHVGSVCLQLPREHGGSQHASWAGVDVRLFVGLPGRPEDLRPAQSPLLAAT